MIKAFTQIDFSDQDLRGKDFSHGVYTRCNFDRANLSSVNCEGSDFIGSTFRQTICHRTNFKDARLGATVFEPSDAYGITITLACQTFINMKVSQLWWYCWLILLSMMQPAQEPITENLKDKLIAMIGAVRYVKLKAMFDRRDV